MIVRRFISDIRRRVKRLIVKIHMFLDVEDELGLEHRTTLLTLARRTYEFRSDADKLKAFNEWFAQQVEADVFSVAPGTDPTKPWTATYVESAYKRALINAYLTTKQGKLLDELGIGEQSQADFLRTAFNSSEALAKLRLLSTRSFEDLKGFTSAMAADLNRILANGIGNGTNPREIARTMQESITSLTRRRAEAIARTEIIHAHSEGMLDAFERLGVRELGIMAEWSTAGDNRVCPLCAEREGEVFTIDEARGLIPLHVNCRCSWIPVTNEP